MDSFLKLPEILQETIFSYLEITDLLNCSQVCAEWYHIINSNRIWKRKCEESDFLKKETYKETSSLFENPTMRYSEDSQFSPPCRWKSHFMRCTYIKNNWRSGRYVKLKFNMRAVYANERYLVESDSQHLHIRDFRRNMTTVGSILVPFDDQVINSVVGIQEYIAFTQGRVVILLREQQGTFNPVFRFELRNVGFHHKRVELKLSSRFFLIIDHEEPVTIRVCPLQEDVAVKKEFILESVFNSHKRIEVDCCEVLEDAMFVAYHFEDMPFLAKYNYVSDSWDELGMLEDIAAEMFISKRFACVKLFSEQRDKLVSVWDHQVPFWPIRNVSYITVSSLSKVVFISEDRAMYHVDKKLVVQNLDDRVKVEFNLRTPAMFQFEPIWNEYLVLFDDEGISIWDWKKGKKLNCPIRFGGLRPNTPFHFNKLIVSDKNIVIQMTESNKCTILSYW